MNTKFLLSVFSSISLLFISTTNVVACTAIMVTDVEGNAYHGRTMEFSELIPTAMSYFPAGSKIQSATPAGNQGVTFDTAYPILAMTIVDALPKSKQPVILEGVNDQGLSFSANALNGSTSPAVGMDDKRILSTADLGAWILGNFKTVAEVKAAMLSDKTEFWLPTIQMMDNKPLPLHYAIFDKTGGALVVEFLNGKKNIYDNPVGVMTNGPEFTWHLTNLNNYTFSNVNKNTGQLGSLKLVTQDAGIALTALPSAQTATGRFVKAAFFANYVRKANTPDDAIITLGHIMNNFDRPYDLTKDGGGGAGDGPRSNAISSEVTTWTVMNDLSRNLLYVRTIKALNWTMIDLNKLKDVKQFKTISTYDVDKAGADAFKLFY